MEIIKARVKDSLDSPLHFVAYLLNPYYFFKDMDIQLDNEVMDGLFNCVEMFYDGELQGHVINVELSKYTRKEGDFEKLWVVQRCVKNDDNYNPNIKFLYPFLVLINFNFFNPFVSFCCVLVYKSVHFILV